MARYKVIKLDNRYKGYPSFLYAIDYKKGLANSNLYVTSTAGAIINRQGKGPIAWPVMEPDRRNTLLGRLFHDRNILSSIYGQSGDLEMWNAVYSEKFRSDVREDYGFLAAEYSWDTTDNNVRLYLKDDAVLTHFALVIPA